MLRTLRQEIRRDDSSKGDDTWRGSLTGTEDDDYIFHTDPGNGTLTGGGGNDVLVSDMGSFYLPGTAGSTFGSAGNITTATIAWSYGYHSDVFNSTTVPHTTLAYLPPGGTQAWWQITVTAGATITLDIDYGRDPTQVISTDVYLRIYEADGTSVVASNDDNPGALDNGSYSLFDSLLTYTFASAGTYYINASEVFDGSNYTLETDDNFLLHVSLTGQGATLTPTVDNDTLNAGAGDDWLIGNAGNDTLNGGTGADTMNGGIGDDLYIVDNAGDIVIEDLLFGGGTDTVKTAITYVLPQYVENLILGGSVAINGTGNGYNNIITGNAAANTLIGGGGDDTLNGGAGADVMNGGVGSDVYIVDNLGDVVIDNSATLSPDDLVKSSVSFVLGVGLENLELTGSAAINGTSNAQDNYITGNSGVNTLNGGAGNDTLSGGAGADTMNGASGNDTYYVGNGDVVSEGLNAGTDTIYTGLNYTLGANFETLILTGSGAINGTGNGLDNEIVGNGAANTLNGGAGNDFIYGGVGSDTMIGGAGDDRYGVDSAGDIVTELAGGGIDEVTSTVNYVLGAEVENLVLEGLAINGKGNAGNNVITGNFQSNTLLGGAGDDILDGGSGNDVLGGNAGADTFVFTTHPSLYTDTINDFVSVDDTIRLDNRVFDTLGAGTLSTNAFYAGSSAHDASDRIIYNPTNGNLFYDPDGQGGVTQYLFATLTGAPTINATDFVIFTSP